MNKLAAGDMVAIPSGDRYGLAKVVYASEYFKNVVLIKLYRTTYRDANIKNFPDGEVLADAYYTSSDPVTEGRWTKIGFQAISDAEKLMSKRTVAGDVWIADEHCGPASKQDLATLPKMLTYGNRLIEKAISRLPGPA